MVQAELETSFKMVGGYGGGFFPTGLAWTPGPLLQCLVLRGWPLPKRRRLDHYLYPGRGDMGRFRDGAGSVSHEAIGRPQSKLATGVQLRFSKLH